MNGTCTHIILNCAVSWLVLKLYSIIIHIESLGKTAASVHCWLQDGIHTSPPTSAPSFKTDQPTVSPSSTISEGVSHGEAFQWQITYPTSPPSEGLPGLPDGLFHLHHKRSLVRYHLTFLRLLHSLLASLWKSLDHSRVQLSQFQHDMCDERRRFQVGFSILN